MKKKHTLCIASVLLLTCCLNVIQACSTPVFQYALERWEPDPHILSVFYTDTIDQDQQDIIDTFNAFLDDFEGSAPLTIEMINVNGEMNEEQTALFTQLTLPILPIQGTQNKKIILPRVVLQRPFSADNTLSLRDGELSEKFFLSLLDSKMRRQLADKLLGGESFVWVLIESGDAEKDNAAEAILKSTIKDFIPEMQEDINQRLTMSDDLGNEDEEDEEEATAPSLALSLENVPQVKTSIIRLKRNDPEEQLLLDMLLQGDNELIDSKDPIAIPVFGEGRALWSLMGSGINDELISESMYFLCGSCSCQIKAQNPGYDIFIPVDWQKLIENRVIGETSVPPLMGPSVWEPVANLEKNMQPITDPALIKTISDNLKAEPVGIEVDSIETENTGPSLILVIAIILGSVLVISTVVIIKRGSS